MKGFKSFHILKTCVECILHVYIIYCNVHIFHVYLKIKYQQAEAELGQNPARLRYNELDTMAETVISCCHNQTNNLKQLN